MNAVTLRPIEGLPSDTETLGTLVARDPVELQRMIRKAGHVRLDGVDDTLVERLRARAPRCGFLVEVDADEEDDWRTPGRPVADLASAVRSADTVEAGAGQPSSGELDAVALWQSTTADRSQPSGDMDGLDAPQRPPAAFDPPAIQATSLPGPTTHRSSTEPEGPPKPLASGSVSPIDQAGEAIAPPPPPGVVLACGLLLPGGGQLCLGEVTRALEVFLASVLLIPWPLAAARAARRSEAIRRGEQKPSAPPAWRVLWLAVPLFWGFVGLVGWTALAPVPEVRVVPAAEADAPGAESEGVRLHGAPPEVEALPEVSAQDSPDEAAAPADAATVPPVAAHGNAGGSEGPPLVFPELPESVEDDDDDETPVSAVSAAPGAEDGGPSTAAAGSAPLVAALVVEAEEACREGAHDRCLRLAERALRLDPASRPAIRLRIEAMIGMQEASGLPPEPAEQ